MKRCAYEPPGACRSTIALHELTSESTAGLLEEAREAFAEIRIQLGYGPVIRDPNSPIGVLERGFGQHQKRDRAKALDAVSDKRFIAARRKRNRAYREAVRELLKRLSNGDVTAFGSPVGSESFERNEISRSSWAKTSIADFPIHGRDWTVQMGPRVYGDLTFHDSEELEIWKEGLPLERALEALFPGQFTKYRRAVRKELGAEWELDLLKLDLIRALKAGAFELQALFPPGPSAEFRKVSDVQSQNPDFFLIDVAKSEVQLRGTGWIPASICFAGLDQSAEKRRAIRKVSKVSIEAEALEFLKSIFRSGTKTMNRAECRKLVQERYTDLSGRGFDRVWAKFTADPKFEHFAARGRPRNKTPHQ